MRQLLFPAAVLAAGLAALLPTAAAPLQDAEPIAPLPTTLTLDSKRQALGERLFRDPRLSRRGDVSCASCHPLDHGGADGLPRAPSAFARDVLRNTPTVFNSAFNASFNWDGSARTLQEQAEGVIRSPAQFDNDWPRLLAALNADARYVEQFKAAYPDGVTRPNVLDALAVYQRGLVTPNARFDQYLRGQRDALSATELEGYRLFKSFGCAACHQGVNVGGNLYQKFGVFRDTKPGRRPGEEPDLGRWGVTHQERHREVFRVPSLRNVELTPPYFHDGRAATLEEAVRTMAKVQLDRVPSDHETQAIVQFLRTLTGEFNGRPLRSGAAPAEAPR